MDVLWKQVNKLRLIYLCTYVHDFAVVLLCLIYLFFGEQDILHEGNEYCEIAYSLPCEDSRADML